MDFNDVMREGGTLFIFGFILFLIFIALAYSFVKRMMGEVPVTTGTKVRYGCSLLFLFLMIFILIPVWIILEWLD
jgi:hypothetical protein